MERYTVKRTIENGVIVLLDGHRMTNHDEADFDGDKWNDEALYWLSVPGHNRAVDVALLAAQYAYSTEIEPIENARPNCTDGSIGAGYCTRETVSGSLYCLHHSEPMAAF